MSAPLIGLTTRNNTDPKLDIPIITSPRSYTEALIKADAIPLLIPVNLDLSLFSNLLSRLDALIFTGGGDIALDHFEGEDHENIYGVDPERDALELHLARTIVEMEMPFLGICRGFQVLNVALGGSLHTHIEDQVPGAVQHACFHTHPTDYKAHQIDLKAGSLLAQIYGQGQVEVNSLHHQGANRIANRFEVTGRSPDGLVEAFELPGHPFGLGVQWHPEWMPEDEYQQKLFQAFIRAAQGYQGKRG